jgi:hypothetical protein
LIAKLLLAITMAVSALLGGSGPVPHTQDGVSAVGAFYLHTDEHGVPTLWSEGNGLPGLQTGATFLHGGIVVPPDTRLTV